MDGVDVPSEVAFFCEAFITNCARKGRGIGGVYSFDVFGEAAFIYEVFATYLAGKGRGRVCVFVLQVESHALLGFGGLLAQAAQEGLG